MFGFRFEDDNEAYQFHETVMVRTKARREFPSFVPFLSVASHIPFIAFPALVKPSASPRTWSKSVRRRTTMNFSPGMSQIADPEPGSFQHKAHVGLDETGNVVTEGEVDRKWSDTLGGTAPRPKVSFTRLRSELWVEVNIVVFSYSLSDLRRYSARRG